MQCLGRPSSDGMCSPRPGPHPVTSMLPSIVSPQLTRRATLVAAVVTCKLTFRLVTRGSYPDAEYGDRRVFGYKESCGVSAPAMGGAAEVRLGRAADERLWTVLYCGLLLHGGLYCTVLCTVLYGGLYCTVYWTVRWTGLYSGLFCTVDYTLR